MAVVTTGLLAEWHAAQAKNGRSPGNNTDPTETWVDIRGGYNLTLDTGFPHDATGGFIGAGTVGNPYRLKTNGTSDCRAYDGYSAFNFGTGDFSLECWFVGITDGGGHQKLIWKGAASGNLGFRLGYGTDGKPYILKGGVSTYVEGSVGSGTVNDGALHHMVATFDYDGNCTVYVDGSSVGTRSIASATGSMDDTTNLYVGTGWSADEIAVVRIYSGLLSSSDVSANYAAGVNATSFSSSPSDIPCTSPRNDFAWDNFRDRSKKWDHFWAGGPEQSLRALTAPLGLGAIQAAAVLANTPPARTATAPLSLGSLGAAATLTNTPPARTLSVGCALGTPTAAAVLANVPPARSITAAGTLGTINATATLANVPPARALTAGTTLGSLAAAATLANTPPARSVAAACTIGALSASTTMANVGGSALSAVLTLGALECTAVMTNTPPARSVAASLTIGTPEAAAVLVNVPPARSLAGNTTLGALSNAAIMSNTPPARSVAASLTIGAPSAAAVMAIVYGVTMEATGARRVWRGVSADQVWSDRESRRVWRAIAAEKGEP